MRWRATARPSARSPGPLTAGSLLLSRAPVHGRNPVHVVVSPDDRFAVICNHLTVDGFVSNVAAFPIGPDGALSEPSDVLPVHGEIGVNRKEQPYAKPHHAQFSPDGSTIAVADKGLGRGPVLFTG